MTDVRRFGATGDGTSDDTEALLHAITDGEGFVEFSPGTYRITQTIEIDLAQHGLVALSGAHGTARIVMDAAGPAIRFLGHHAGTADPPSVQPPVWQRERFPTITGLEIIGTNAETDGIELVGTMQATLDRLLIRRVRHGIHLVQRNRNFLLTACHIYDNSGVGVFFDRCNLHQVIISGNHISYNRQCGIKSLGGDLHNLQITGNDIEYNYADDAEGAADIWFDARDGVASEITIASNTIQARVSRGGTNIRIAGNPEPPTDSARVIAITGNVIGSQATNVDVRHADRVVVNGNTIYDGHELAIFAEECRQLVVTSNSHGWSRGPAGEMNDSIRLVRCRGAIVSGLAVSHSRAGETSGGGAISLIDCDDSAVSNCQVLAPHWRGIFLEDCRRCRVDGNSVLSGDADSTMLVGVEVTGRGGGNVVQNNLLAEGREAAIRCPEKLGRLQGNTILT